MPNGNVEFGLLITLKNMIKSTILAIYSQVKEKKILKCVFY
jgi:hypothetical protein